MPEKVHLPGGHWAVLRDPMDISEREARKFHARFVEQGQIMRGTSKGPVKLNATKLEQQAEFEHEVLASFIEDWDFPQKPSPDSLMDLPRAVYNALDEATRPLLHVILPGLPGLVDDDDEDEG